MDASQSTDNTGIVAYSWDFGDNSQGSGVTATHTYANAGTYTAKLTVQDAAGNTATITVIIVVQASKPVATPTPTPAPTPTPTPKSNPTPNPTPTLTPSPMPNSTTVQAIEDNASLVDLLIAGNITSQQISSITMTTNHSARTTTIFFNVTGESGTTGFCNITIPKSSVPYGTTPTIYVDNQICQNQSYTEDANNYYLWYATHFSTHQISIVFNGKPSPSGTSLSMWLWPVLALFIIAMIAGVLMQRRKGKVTNESKLR